MRPYKHLQGKYKKTEKDVKPGILPMGLQMLPMFFAIMLQKFPTVAQHLEYEPPDLPAFISEIVHIAPTNIPVSGCDRTGPSGGLFFSQNCFTA